MPTGLWVRTRGKDEVKLSPDRDRVVISLPGGEWTREGALALAEMIREVAGTVEDDDGSVGWSADMYKPQF